MVSRDVVLQFPVRFRFMPAPLGRVKRTDSVCLPSQQEVVTTGECELVAYDYGALRVRSFGADTATSARPSRAHLPCAENEHPVRP